MGFVNECTEDHSWRTVDYERNIVLKKLGGGTPQEPIKFEIIIDSTPVIFEAFQRTETLNEIKKLHVDWDIWGIYHPESLEREYVSKIIDEALREYGFAASTDLVAGLNVNFGKKQCQS